jgi:hypothetical protein
VYSSLAALEIKIPTTVKGKEVLGSETEEKLLRHRLKKPDAVIDGSN